MPLSNFQFPLSTLANQLPDLPTGPALENVRGPIEASGFSATQIALVILVAAALSALLIRLFIRSHKKTPPPLGHKAVALAELDAAIQAGDDERLALVCANAVRRFYAEHYKLPASSLTSAELHRQLPLESKTKDEIRKFLDQCDSVKFAGESLSEESRIQLVDTAKGFIYSEDRKEAPAA